MSPDSPAQRFESDLRQLILRHKNWPKAPSTADMIHALQHAVTILKRKETLPQKRQPRT